MTKSAGIGTSARFWLALQASYDLDMAPEALGERLEQEVRPVRFSTAAKQARSNAGD